MTELKQPAATGRGKPSLAAGIFAVAFIFSASLMIWSGWQLYHGESLPVVLTATETQCQWVMLLDEPAMLKSTLAELEGQAADLPTGVTRYLAELRPLCDAAESQRFETTQAWTLCGLPDGAVLTVPNAAGQQEVAQTLARHWAELPESPTPLIAWQHATVHVDGPVVRVVFALPGGNPEAILARARPQSVAANLAADTQFRASTERVGNAPVHLYLPAATAQAWLKTLAPSPWWTGGIDVVQWLGVMARVGEGHLRVHAHLGGDEQMGAWLKPVFDVATLDEVGEAVAQNAKAAAVVRIPAKTRGELANWYGPQAPLFRALLRATPTELPDGTLVWQQFADGGEAALWHGTSQGPSAVQRAQVGEWTIVGTNASAVAAVREVLGRPSTSLAETDDRDRRRLLTSTQGWFRGALQVDWVWTDSGVAGEVAWQLIVK